MPCGYISPYGAKGIACANNGNQAIPDQSRYPYRIMCVSASLSFLPSLRASAHTGVAIRPPEALKHSEILVGRREYGLYPQGIHHTSDIGHWFAMTKTGHFYL